MPHPKKKQRMTGNDANYLVEAAATDHLNQVAASADDLSVDVMANIFGFLKGIMRQRRVCKKWKEAVKMTIVPLNTDVFVDDMRMYNAMNVMTTEMPNLQQITIGDLGGQYKYNDGEDPNEYWSAQTADWTTLNINIISNFSKLRELYIDGADLNGRYPFLFNSFPLLQKLYIRGCGYLKWDLDMLAAFPLLNEFDSEHNYALTGDIKSLRVLKDTLEKVVINQNSNIKGNFMDLADFPSLKKLDLEDTAVTGDIRDIGDDDFSSLEDLILPKRVYGGHGYDLQRISDAPDLVRAVYLFNKQRPTLKMNGRWYAVLSEDSPDRYDSADDAETPPFYVFFVEAGSRVGYRWETNLERPCEVNWLDPEPAPESRDFEKYTEELQKIEEQEQVSIYGGFHEPPTEEEYRRLWGE